MQIPSPSPSFNLRSVFHCEFAPQNSHFFQVTILSPHHYYHPSLRSITSNQSLNLWCRYDKALEAVKGHESQLKEHKPVDIGEKYLDFLVEHGKVQQAAALCPSILKKDQTLWEKWIFRFVKIKELRVCNHHSFSILLYPLSRNTSIFSSFSVSESQLYHESHSDCGSLYAHCHYHHLITVTIDITLTIALGHQRIHSDRESRIVRHGVRDGSELFPDERLDAFPEDHHGMASQTVQHPERDHRSPRKAKVHK